MTTPSSYETADELDQTAAISEEDSDGDIDEDASTLKKTRQAFERACAGAAAGAVCVRQLGPSSVKAYKAGRHCANKRGEVVRYSVGTEERTGRLVWRARQRRLSPAVVGARPGYKWASRSSRWTAPGLV